jgi:molecular chaperone DnaK (HSP70)
LLNAPGFEAPVLPAQPGVATTIELIPRKLNQHPDPVQKDGLRCFLKLVGDFTPTRFGVRICHLPHLRWEVQGRGVRRNDAAGGDSWLVQRREWLDLQMRLLSDGAPVKLVEQSTEADLHPVLDPRGIVPDLNLYEVPPVGTEVLEGSSATWRLRVDSRCFTSVGQKLKLTPKWQLAGGRGNQLPAIEMKYAPSDVSFEPHELAVPQMYWGEVRSNNWTNRDENPDDPLLTPVISELYIRNDGVKPVKLKRPEVPAHKEGRELWLETAWLSPGHADDNDEIELLPNSSAAIMVRIDFRQNSVLRNYSMLHAVDPGPRGSIRVTAADDSDFWPVTIQVGRVLPRKPCPYPLAVDFGNSFSYAALLNEGIIRELSDPILAVHARFIIEEFPTTLAIRRFLSDHPFRSEFTVVIPLATANSADDGNGWTVTDLKGWLGQDEGDHERPVIDAGKVTHYVRVSTLVQMFFLGVIQRAEAILRQYFVSEIVTSCPAKLTPRARRRYLSLVDDLCERITKERESRDQPLQHCHGKIDQANAVATGFVLGNEQIELQQSPLDPPKVEFVVASVDFGGGSLDTALLRFRVENPDDAIPTYSSEYLGIGGQSDFGGDNVTIAVMEILRDRISAKLPHGELAAGILDDLPSPQIHPKKVGASRERYDALWAAADWCRRLLCCAVDRETFPRFQYPVQSASVEVRGFITFLVSLMEDPLFLPSLDEIYGHSVRADQHGKTNYTVESRLTDTVKELFHFARKDSNTGFVDYIVLGGGGTQIPLVQKELRNLFPDAAIVFNPGRLKCRVAEGLVRTIDYLNDDESNLALSGQCTTRSLGVLVTGNNRPIVLIPACAKVVPAERFPLALNGKPIAVKQVSRGGQLTVYADVEQPRFRRAVGFADLEKLTVLPGANSTVALCFAGHDEESLQLFAETDGQSQILDFQPVA